MTSEAPLLERGRHIPDGLGLVGIQVVDDDDGSDVGETMEPTLHISDDDDGQASASTGRRATAEARVMSADAPPLKKKGHAKTKSFDEKHFASLASVEDLLANIDQLDRITMSWEHVKAFVPAKRGRCFGLTDSGRHERRQILNDVSGMVRPGQLLALIGASGSGKTTLLNALSGRNRHSRLVYEGDIRINGHRVENRESIAAISAYVQQQDLFVGLMTVREYLQFHARLRMSSRTTRKQLEARVDEVMLELGLARCQWQKIGIPGHTAGISGGEMKRLSFAAEILNHPPLLFADEPTSGLDAFMAQQTISMLKHMAAKHSRSIICTIHQPSSEIFQMFNSLCILAEGRVAYLGPSRLALRFFERLDLPCPANFNPADHYIHQLSVWLGRERECRERIASTCRSYDEAFGAQNQRRIQELVEEAAKEDDESAAGSGASPESDSMPSGSSGRRKKWRLNCCGAAASGGERDEGSSVKSPTWCGKFRAVASEARWRRSPYRVSWWQQFRVCLWREVLCSWREPRILQARIAQTVVISLLFGMIYLRDYNDGWVHVTEIQNINGIMFLMLTSLSFGNLFAVLNHFIDETAVFLREHGAGLYRTDVYFLAKNMIDLPSFGLLSLLMHAILYFMVGLRAGVGSFIMGFAVVALTSYVAIGLGYALSTTTGNFQTAAALGAPICVILFIFGGFFLNAATVPWYFRWLEKLSWFKYANEVLNVNQWSAFSRINCSAPDGLGNQTIIGGGIPLSGIDLPAIINTTLYQSNAKWARTLRRFFTKADIQEIIDQIPRFAKSEIGSNATNGAGICPRGDAVLSGLSFEPAHVWFDLVMLVVLCAAFRFIALAALWNRARRS